MATATHPHRNIAQNGFDVLMAAVAESDWWASFLSLWDLFEKYLTKAVSQQREKDVKLFELLPVSLSLENLEKQ